MATAEELLALTGSTDQILTVDLNTREIKIPNTVLNLGVESDDDVKRIYFRMPKRYGEFDLSTFDIRVNYMNANKKGGVYVVNDMTVSTDGIMTFSWLVDRHVIEYSGKVEFNLCLKILNSEGVVIKEFNTTPTSLSVLNGLETDETIVEENPSAFDSVLARLYAVEAANGLGKHGYYSIVKITENDEGIVFTLTDQDGEKQAVVKNGYVPVKGVDYWTQDDQQTMYNYINAWAPKEESVVIFTTGWTSNKTQIVNVSGVTSKSIVFVSPDVTDPNYDEYITADVKCVEQNDNALTFSCEYPPDIDVKANIAILYSSDVVGGGGSGAGGGIASVTDDGNGNVYLT